MQASGSVVCVSECSIEMYSLKRVELISYHATFRENDLVFLPTLDATIEFAS